ncbi:MAG: alpha-D-ribose 1-methylphosphonate 5-triphosphate diphosphatase [Pseudomonadota bacterium]
MNECPQNIGVNSTPVPEEPVVLANARLVLPDTVTPGTVIVENGQIAEIRLGSSIPQGAIDLGGDYLAPGLVELHTDNLERHLTPRPSVTWPVDTAIRAHDAELAVNGITTVFDALRVGSVVSRKRTNYSEYAWGVANALRTLSDSGELRIDHRIHLRAEICSETLTDELARFDNSWDVGLLSLMDHTPGARQFRDLDQLRKYLIGKHGLTEAQFQDHIRGQQTLKTQNGAAHEAAAIAAARRTGAVIASHDDTTHDDVARSAAHGVRVAEFPTTEEAARASRAAGISVMMGAPNLIRGMSHSGNVSARTLAEAGCLDIVSSDYVPAALLASVGVLNTLWSDLPRAFRTVSTTPADASGLSDRGKIAPGKKADLIRVRQASDGLFVRETWVGGRRVA